MAIEIKELHVRINVKERSRSNINKSEQLINKETKDDLIHECVQIIMEKLEEKQDR